MSDGVEERRVETDPHAPATARMKMIRMRRDLLDIAICEWADFAVLEGQRLLIKDFAGERRSAAFRFRCRGRKRGRERAGDESSCPSETSAKNMPKGIGLFWSLFLTHYARWRATAVNSDKSGRSGVFSAGASSSVLNNQILVAK